MQSSSAYPPYKSVAVALLFCVFLGPLGLLYASFWGSLGLTLIGVVVVARQLFALSILLWLVSCFWSVRAVERHNNKLYAKKYLST